MSNSTAPMALQTQLAFDLSGDLTEEAPKPVQSYADKINSQYRVASSEYVDIATRLRNTINDKAHLQKLIKDAVENALKRNPRIKSWKDMEFCETIMIPLDQLFIDVTMQRLLDLLNCSNILDHFDDFMVRPIMVYRDENSPDKLVLWDGQHTATCLYLLCMALGEDPSKCTVPVVVSRNTNKAKMRRTFIGHNGDAVKQLDTYDLVEQKLFAVQVDGDTQLDFVEISNRQQALAARGMFITHPKREDDNMPGAYSRLDEFVRIDYYSLNVVDNFAEYFYQICKSGRAVQPKETWMLYEFFRECEKAKIKVDKSYIKELADSLRVVNDGDFDSIKFYKKAKSSYAKYWLESRLALGIETKSLRGISYPEHPVGLTFLFAQIKKNFSRPLPRYVPLWKVPKADLF